MKVKLIDAKPTIIDYPILVQAIKSEEIVLFSTCCTGTVIYPGQSRNVVGSRSEKWVQPYDTRVWRRYKGRIELENDDG